MTTWDRFVSLAVVACVIAGAVLAAPGAARPQGTTADVDRYFRVEWDPEPVPRGGWAVQGYVYSTHLYRVSGVRLLVEVLDSSGEVLHRAYGWVAGDVPAGGRAYFYVSVPGRGAAYRVKVVSFFLVSREAS
jgi:hypothetical protein